MGDLMPRGCVRARKKEKSKKKKLRGMSSEIIVNNFPLLISADKCCRMPPIVLINSLFALGYLYWS